MTIEEVFEHWEIDSKVDKTEVSWEAAKVSTLQYKYRKMYSIQNLLLKKEETRLAKLKLEKHEFYTQGPSSETPKDWEYPAIGKILNKDLDLYMNADKQIVEQVLKIAYQREIVDTLKQIIDSISNRSYLLNSIVAWESFLAGAT